MDAGAGLLSDLDDLTGVLLRIAALLAGLGICAVLLYLAYDALRSALLGIQPSASAPDEDHESPVTRMMWWTTPAPGIECAKG
jgi:hypothetical protein